MIQNHGTEAVRLERGCALGSVVPVEVVEPETGDEVSCCLSLEQ